MLDLYTDGHMTESYLSYSLLLLAAINMLHAVCFFLGSRGPPSLLFSGYLGFFPWR